MLGGGERVFWRGRRPFAKGLLPLQTTPFSQKLLNKQK
jgi:hypothetical protein